MDSSKSAAATLRAAGWEPSRLRTDRLYRAAVGADASHYALTPEAVLIASSAADVALAMRTATSVGTSVTFRSGGTSLSGQGVTGGLLVDTRRAFRGIQVLDDGESVRVEPGATLRSVNAALARHRRKIGPDPASEVACTIGGIVSNNSSGMSCGVAANTYNTLESIEFVLPSGTMIDTAAPDADGVLAAREPALHSGLLRLRERVTGVPDLVDRIRRTFAIKNTMGYGVNSLLDFERPIDILRQLLVGSEGTLAFVASATLRTVPLKPFASAGLLAFPHLHTATSAIAALTDSGASKIELLDARSLEVASRDSRAPEGLGRLGVRQETAALLVEYEADSEDELREMSEQATAVFDWTSPGSEPLTSEPARRDTLWRIRKGLFATVASSRRRGTTALLEDIAVPVDHLTDTCRELDASFRRHGYDDSVIFGHAKDGNLHFMLTESFDDPSGVERYSAFTEELVDLVLANAGTLKAEHGTGRVMAPFIERQYGAELVDVMREIKHLFDPTAVLSPGVILTERPDEHLHNLKTTLPIEVEADRCVECGFCEPVCPSQDLTLTPRQRIVARRARAAAAVAGDDQLVREHDEAFRYPGQQTCAADGMCQTTCPVGIDTGALIKRLRAEDQSKVVSGAGGLAARHWGVAVEAAGWAVSTAHRMPRLAALASRAGRRILGTDVVPLYDSRLPRGGLVRKPRSAGPSPQVVFMPACMGTVFGTDRASSTAEAVVSLCTKAGIGVRTPDDIASLCCGMPWTSKGLTRGRAVMATRVRQALWEATEGGKLPVIVDASSCTEGLSNDLDTIQVDDAVTFVAREVLPYLAVAHAADEIAVHPTCSSTRSGYTPALLDIAGSMGPVFIPPSWGCCGFAGDRGLLHPELTQIATQRQAAEIRKSSASLFVSSNRTCEIGMTLATGHTYRHVLAVLDERSRPLAPTSTVDSHGRPGGLA